MCKHDRVECDMDVFAEVTKGDTGLASVYALYLIEHGDACWGWAAQLETMSAEHRLQAYSIALAYFRAAAS